MAVEGAIRAFAALAFGTVLPTGLLGLVAALHDRLDGAMRAKGLRLIPADEIRPARDDSYDLHILSARRKSEWSPFVGIRFRNEVYVLAGEETEPGLRPFGYRLRKSPAGDLVVVTCSYDPETW